VNALNSNVWTYMADFEGTTCYVTWIDLMADSVCRRFECPDVG